MWGPCDRGGMGPAQLRRPSAPFPCRIPGIGLGLAASRRHGRRQPGPVPGQLLDDPRQVLGPCAEPGHVGHGAYWRAAESVPAARTIAGLERPGAGGDDVGVQVVADLYLGLPADERTAVGAAMAEGLGVLWFGTSARRTITPPPGRCTQLISVPYSSNAGTLATRSWRRNRWAEPQTRTMRLTTSQLRPPLSDAAQTGRPRGPLGITRGTQGSGKGSAFTAGCRITYQGGLANGTRQRPGTSAAPTTGEPFSFYGIIRQLRASCTQPSARPVQPWTGQA